MTFTTEAPPGYPGTGDDYDVRVPHGSPDDVSPGVGDLDGFRGMRGASRDRAFLAVECEIRRLRAVQARMVTEVNQSGSFLDDGHRSPTNWVQAVTNSSRPSAITITDTAKLIERLPTLAAAFHTGQIGTDQIKLLTKLNTNPRCRDRLPESEQLLLDCARTLTYHDFRRACQRWQNHADPDGAHRDHETSHRNRRVSTATVGAGHILHAEGDALSGDIIGDILNQHTESEFHRDIAERAARYGDQANQHPLARTSQQRRYDALMTIFLKAAAGTDQTRRTPLVNIICTPDVLLDAIRDLLTQTGTPSAPTGSAPTGSAPTGSAPTGSAPTGSAPTDGLGSTGGLIHSHRFRLCETTTGAPVDPRDLAIAALTGHIRRVITDTAGRVTNLGRRQRLFTGATREAVLLTGNQCTHPGCDRTLGIHIDHLQPWARDNGPTDTINGGPNCPQHNNHKHTNNTTVTRNETGWHHHRPNGTEIAPRHHN